MDVQNNIDPIQQRQRYVSEWNEMMITIWREKIQKLGIVDTGALYNSLRALPVMADGRFYEIGLVQEFNLYGIYQDRGTGREVPKGNPGDIGRDKVRKKREWYSLKYYASVNNLRDFLADSIGEEFVGVIRKEAARNATTYRTGYMTE